MTARLRPSKLLQLLLPLLRHQERETTTRSLPEFARIILNVVDSVVAVLLLQDLNHKAPELNKKVKLPSPTSVVDAVWIRTVVLAVEAVEVIRDVTLTATLELVAETP